MSLLVETFEFLLAAIVVVPLFRRLGLSAVLGYLAAGVLLGPYGLALVGDPAEVLHFAEIGVVMLLFVIGLELQPRRLWVMRRAVFGLGSAQVGVTALVLAGLAVPLLGLDLPSAGLLGFALALSSTAFVLQLLGEQKQLGAPHGRAAFGTLLFQDVAVIPAIAWLNVAAASDEPATRGWIAVLGPTLLVVGGLVAARFALRPALRFVASTGIHELFTAAALAIVLGASIAMHSVGLSMGLGAFVAGMMVADSEYRRQLETDVTPFKGLLLGLFFIAVGMSVDLGLLAAEPLRLAAATVGLVAVKAAVLLPLARGYGLRGLEALRTAVVLSQGGEFAFVLLTAAVAGRLLDETLAAQAVVVVTLSMVTTPFLVAACQRWLERDRSEERPWDVIDDQRPPVIIAGFGRFGQIVSRVLAMRGIPFTALEASPTQVDFVRRFGNEIHFGDARRLDLLRQAGIEQAKVFVLAVDDADTALQIAGLVRESFPQVRIVARARNRLHELQLRDLGIEVVLRELLPSSAEAAEAVLAGLGVEAEEARRSVALFREHDRRTLERQAAIYHDSGAFREAAKDAAEQLKEVFEADRGSR